MFVSSRLQWIGTQQAVNGITNEQTFTKFIKGLPYYVACWGKDDKAKGRQYLCILSFTEVLRVDEVPFSTLQAAAHRHKT